MSRQNEAREVCWLAHDDENRIEVLYAAYRDTPASEAKYLTKMIRRGFTVRRMLDKDGARAAWGKIISEAEMRRIAAPVEYDLDDGNATQIGLQLAGGK